MILFLAVVADTETRHQLEVMYGLYAKELWFVANGILKDPHEAEDVVQTAFIRVAKYMDKNFDPNCNKSKALIVIIVRNLAMDVYNQRKRRSTVAFEAVEYALEDDVFVAPEVHILRLDQSREVAKKLTAIKPAYSDILTLRYTFDYDDSEIAALLGIKEGNVRARLSRARKALHKVIGGVHDV